jgi:phosphate transport system protein
MQSFLEESFQRDIDRIKKNIVQMAGFAETALKDCLKACIEFNQELAYVVILKDLYIDEKEKEIDRLCLEFFIRHQPVALPMRFAFSTIKVNLEIERIGDYAESIARRVLNMKEKPGDKVISGIKEMAELAIEMFHDSVAAFVDQKPELAKKAIEIEEAVDGLRHKLTSGMVQKMVDHSISYEVVEPLINIVRRFERVADQARNISMEALYMVTGEQLKHPGAEAFRVIFIDEHNSCRSQIAEAMALSLKQSRFIFNSAGLDPEPMDRTAVDFMKTKGFDLTHAVPKSVHQIPNLEHYHAIVALSPEVRKMFPKEPRKAIFLDWSIDNPCCKQGGAAEKGKAFEQLFQFLQTQIQDLVQAIIGSESTRANE